MEKGDIFGDGGVDSLRVADLCFKGGGGIDSGRVAYRCSKEGYIIGGRVIFWGGRIYMF